MVHYDFCFFGAPNYTYVFEDRKTIYRMLSKQPQEDPLNLKPFVRKYFVEGAASSITWEVICVFLPVLALISYSMLDYIAGQFHTKKFSRNYQSAESSKQENRDASSNRQEDDQDVQQQ